MSAEHGHTLAASSTSAAEASQHQPSIALPAKRGRRSNPKVKTGCSNCKQRRIKCDEKRPACTQCVRSNRSCTGYPPPSRSSGPVVEIRIAPKPVIALRPQPAPDAPVAVLRKPTVLPPRRPSLAIYQPSNSLSMNHAEALYFELFRLQTASEPSGYFNGSFWCQRVLQECHSEVAIRHAIVALGALYKTLEQSSRVGLPASSAPALTQKESIKSHWQVAIKQYSEACNAMLLLHEDNLHHHRTRLMATILLAYFDAFIGDHKQALGQFRTGLSLLQRLHDSHPHHRSPSTPGYIEEDLVVIFTRFALQSKSYAVAFNTAQANATELAPQGQRAEGMPASETIPPASLPPDAPLPHRFGSIMEARQASDKLCEKLLLIIEQILITKNNQGNILPPSWKQLSLTYKHQMDAWSEAFGPIFRSRLDPGVGHLEKLSISALKLFQINRNLLFLTMFCDTEMEFDAFLPHFKATVSLGWEVVAAEERRAATQRCPNPSMCQHHGSLSKSAFQAGKVPARHFKASFSADLGIVPPLFVVVTKCREPRTRRQAIQLLRSGSRREGIWDSELVAKVGEWIMQWEEFNDQVPPGTIPTRPIPEERRVILKAVEFDLRARFADVHVGTRARHDGSPDSRSRKTRLTW
ncbi:fungal zn(2)-Cys(6) binuclear cluster domain-containing protein [Hirsutella rhossiliensis]|uniref:Fungal zn(2)-Cys(6) binuclear cluster domain-containing protein n=1 Tax=Hirsutella rhossiliensis TaxID=111463 RepID=A0A9P8N387_9HYPO|nr:fungal zn(2)-Cys(6) binuclear cluster domain-containing protein [Hirsutella rhossiliensis]KAH0965039.1 fungal zn(2)-Cys(6) binuclear cluster domain-containing protein [Hirsutella rhossiliensis]